MAQLRFLVHSVQEEHLQCFNSSLYSGLMSSSTQPRWEHHLVPFFPEPAGTSDAMGAASPVLWGTPGRKAGSCLHGKIFSPFALAEEAPQKQWGSLQLAPSPEKNVMVHPYKHSPGHFKHLSNGIFNHGFRFRKTLEQVKVNLGNVGGSQRAAWPQHRWISIRTSFLWRKEEKGCWRQTLLGFLMVFSQSL